LRRRQIFDQPCGYGAHERITGNVFGDQCTTRYDAGLPDGDAGQYGGSRRNPRAIFTEDRTPNIDIGAKVRRTDFVVGGDEDTVVADTDAVANPISAERSRNSGALMMRSTPMCNRLWTGPTLPGPLS